MTGSLQAGMDEQAFLINIIIALAAAVTGGLVARLLRLPTLIGYLIAGVVVGPHTPGIFANPTAVKMVSELGVALLMFAVGVHTSLDQLRLVRRTALLGGGAQIAGVALLGTLIGSAFGWGIFGGLFLGCALALSSTAVMMKMLEERGEQGTTHGTVMLGISIVQDFALVAMIVLLPSIASITREGTSALLMIGGAFLRAILFIGIVLALATRVVPALMHSVARTRSRELFLLVVVSLCMLTAVSADYAGLGLALGAFLAGIVVSETDYAHEVFAQIRPLRDVFASLFFVSVGMLLNPSFLLQNALHICVVVLAIIVGKSILTFVPVYLLGWHGRTALLTGFGLANIGEFSFVLAVVGFNRGLIPAEISSVILTSAVLSLLIAPFLYQAAYRLYDYLNRFPALSSRINRQTETVEIHSNHDCPARVLILGYGRVGRYVSDALRAKQIPHCVIDYDLSVLSSLRDETVRVIYGDATSQTVLESAKPDCVELTVVALPEADMTLMAIRLLREMAPDVPVIARVHRGKDIPRIRQAGADAVIHAEFEAGTEMIRQTLDRLGFPDPEVGDYIHHVRLRRYRVEPD